MHRQPFKADRWFGLVADVSAFYPSYTYPPGGSSNAITGKTYDFLFGPQVSVPLGWFVPFGRFLIGATHVTPQTFGGQTVNFFKSNTVLGIGAGGGVDYYVMAIWSSRPGRLALCTAYDYWRGRSRSELCEE
jgi:opacity protein-like surface antigen